MDGEGRESAGDNIVVKKVVLRRMATGHMTDSLRVFQLLGMLKVVT